LAVATALVAALAAAFSTASAQAAPPATSAVTLPATCTNVVTLEPAACTLELVGFTTQGGAIAAVLRFTNEATGIVTQIVVPLVPGTTQQGGTCTILDLTIGPIDLELLGLRLQTNTIRLRLTAQRGTLLGDLLCGLFFGNPAGAATTLNQLLRQGMIRL
jgi:hypothetical protein